ncbi:interleukin-17C [Zootoca vivipara]|uniref:interleukin-17C n=1 Tax=Zootoca vivipara TaxID=8524 RepID=UPI00293BCB93|nr:interleukin-17C [Zootoca vivipara]
MTHRGRGTTQPERVQCALPCAAGLRGSRDPREFNHLLRLQANSHLISSPPEHSINPLRSGLACLCLLFSDPGNRVTGGRRACSPANRNAIVICISFFPFQRSLLLALILLAWAEAKGQGGRHRHHQNCFAAEDVQEGYVPSLFRSRATRWERQAPVQLVPYVESGEASPRRQRRHHETSCPDLKVQGTLNREIHERSISPWTYRIDEDEDRYPRKLSIAECLCKGCIDVKTGQEVTSLNSVPVFQNMMVLRRKPCQHNDEAAGFTFEVKYIDVPVACACVLPRYSS